MEHENHMLFVGPLIINDYFYINEYGTITDEKKTITLDQVSTTISELPYKISGYLKVSGKKQKTFKRKVRSENENKVDPGIKSLRVKIMSNGDFVCSSPNDGTHYFRPSDCWKQTFWISQNYNRFVIDNNEDYYIVKSVDSEKICDEIRKK